MSGDHKRGVGLMGRCGTGKTTLANALIKAGVCDARRGFADVLKHDLRKLGVEKGQPYARETMIAYGMNRRAESPDHWVECLRHATHDDFDGLAIDDVRYRNEAAFLRDRGFLIVRVMATPDERLTRGVPLHMLESVDPSETEHLAIPADLKIDTSELSPGECVAEIAGAMQGAVA